MKPIIKAIVAGTTPVLIAGGLIAADNQPATQPATTQVAGATTQPAGAGTVADNNAPGVIPDGTSGPVSGGPGGSGGFGGIPPRATRGLRG